VITKYAHFKVGWIYSWYRVFREIFSVVYLENTDEALDAYIMFCVHLKFSENVLQKVARASGRTARLMDKFCTMPLSWFCKLSFKYLIHHWELTWMLEVLFNKNKSASILKTLFDLLTHLKNNVRCSTRHFLVQIFWITFVQSYYIKQMFINTNNNKFNCLYK